MIFRFDSFMIFPWFLQVFHDYWNPLINSYYSKVFVYAWTICARKKRNEIRNWGMSEGISLTSMANTLQADLRSACFIATSRPSRSWCWITNANTGHWKFLSPLLREPWAEISRDNSGEGWRSSDDPTSVETSMFQLYFKYFILTQSIANHRKSTQTLLKGIGKYGSFFKLCIIILVNIISFRIILAYTVNYGNTESFVILFYKVTQQYLHPHCVPCVSALLWPVLGKLSAAYHTQRQPLNMTAGILSAWLCHCLWLDLSPN